MQAAAATATATTTATTIPTTTGAKTIKTSATKKILTNSSSTVTSAGAAAGVTGKTRVLQKQQHAVTAHSTTTTTTTTTTNTLDPNSEIEELSKKITEHADAIYQTWRRRGLAPTALPEIYATNVAGASEDFFGPGGNKTDATTAVTAAVAAAAVDNTEGLQQLVNTFVIKDKEQRGVKAAGQGNAIKTATTTTTTTAAKKSTSGIEINNSGEKVTQQTLKKPAVQKARAKSPTATATTTKTSATATATTTSTTSGAAAITTTNASTKNNACVVGSKKLDAATPKKTTTTIKKATSTPTSTMTTTTTSTATSQPPTLDVNLNFDLNLLTKQQTENLLKISELLQKEQTKEKEKERATSTIKRKEPAATTTTSISTATTATAATKKSTKENGKIEARKMATAAQELIPTKNTTTTTKTNTLKSAKTTTASDNKTSANKLAKNNGNNVDTIDVALQPTSLSTTLSTPSYTLQSTSLLINARDRIAAAADDDDDDNDDDDSLNAISNIKTTDKNSATSVNKRGTSTSTLNKLNAEQSQLTSAKLIKAATATITKDNNTKTFSSSTPKALTQSTTTDVTTTTATTTNKVINRATASTATLAKEKPSLNRIAIGAKSSSNSGNVESTVVGSAQSAQLNIAAAGAGGAGGGGNTTAIRTHSVANGASSAVSQVDGGAGMEIARTTMPTLNKVKPTSGRAVLTNGQDKNLGRPILTRGSVAERVLMFEKCPDVRSVFLDIKRPANDVLPKSLQKVKLTTHATPPSSSQEHNSLQREIRSTKSVYIPRFYFPHGKPQPTIAMERVSRGIVSAFDSFPNNQVTKDELPRILKLCGLPFYWRMPVMVYCQQGNSGLVERQRFVEFWKQMNVYCHEDASRFVYILSRGQRFHSYIMPEDLVPLVQDVVDTHPGLAFLKEATEFHSRYVHTVIARIFYSVNRSWSGKITIAELKRSDLLEMISLLEEEDDINQIMAFFSYEHFYVIYCKFWELDKDHDLLINKDDLARHSDHALSTRIVERIFSGCVTRNDNKKTNDDESKMSYTDFVWFILSEEDKRTPTAIEYWFRCMDVDGDGALSMYELEYFYEEQQQRMEAIGIECLPFEDCLCQMLDMIKPLNREFITLGDLKRCKMTHVFFDTFFNLEKYLDHEQRDPFASQRDEYNSDWDRFAAQEYELLITEEND